MSDICDYVTAVCFCKGSFHMDDLYVSDPTFNDWKGGVKINNFDVACRAMIDVGEVVIMNRDVFRVNVGEEMAKLVCDKLKDKLSIELEGNSIAIYGCNLCEVYDVLYKDSSIYKIRNHDYFKKIAYDVGPQEVIPSFRFVKTLPGAVAPQKNKASDSGFDMVLIHKIKEVNGVSFYDTGIQLSPPIGWYFDLVGRSSISKTGYMLANNIGIIDQSYRGNVMVALVKVNPDVPDLELPARLVQIIPRKVWHMQAVESDKIEDTSRGAGGFGSSGTAATFR